MPTVQELLTEIDTTYRNTFTPDRKVKWMHTVQGQIFQKVPKEAPPNQFTTMVDTALYPLPVDCDRSGIKQVTIETKAGSGVFRTLSYLSLESNQAVSKSTPFYSLLEDQLFINPKPTSIDAGKTVTIIYNKRPAALTSTTSGLAATPELEEDFNELLVLGALERIARARGEIDDKNNFASDYNLLLSDYERQYKLRQPEYYQTKDVMPARRRGQWGGSRNYGGSSVSDLIPPGLM